MIGASISPMPNPSNAFATKISTIEFEKNIINHATA